MSDPLYQELLELREKDKQQQERIQNLEHNVELLTQAVLLANKQRFGASSEKTPVDDGQLFLFNEAEQEFNSKTIDPSLETLLVSEHKRKIPIKKAGYKEKLIAELPHEVEECILNEQNAICEICGSVLKVIGKKTVRSEIELIPAHVKVREYVQYTYKCTSCGKDDTYPEDYIVSAPVPKPVMKRSLASPSSVAWIMHQKYALAVPLHRQEKEWLRMGVALERSVMANWVIRCANQWLSPLYDAMKQKLITYDLIMSDETTHQCNKELGKKASSNSYFWLHRTGEYEDIPILVFEYTRTRSGEHARRFLEGFEGYHVSDAYSGYEKVENITRCLCYSHLRRYYLEAIPLDSSKKEIPGSGGAIGRRFCDKLFSIEKKLKDISPEQRKIERLTQSVPVLEAFFAWAEATTTTNTKLQKALNYTLNQKTYFHNFLLDGRIPLTNNASERGLRGVVVGRKNYLFSDTPRGAESSAIVYSIIATAAANGLDSFKYLEYILKQLPNIDLEKNADLIQAYLPWSETIPTGCFVTQKKKNNRRWYSR